MSISVRHATNPTELEIQEAAKVLHEAFQRQYFLSVLGGDETLVEPFLLAHVRATILGGQLYIAQLPDAQLVGIALEDQRNAGWNQTMQVLDETTQKCIPERLYGPGQKLAAYHLQTFGVLPEHQKKGYGMALMSAVEEKAKLTSNNMVLETMDEARIPIYKKLGFEVSGPETVKTPNGQVNAYCFRKRTASLLLEWRYVACPHVGARYLSAAKEKIHECI
ncbi:hypothetical protein FB451DRAFT_1370112 [Mycena latifolia]|nr:hypothetical protein FB451DRAFT_1370112 [Mycena latifolia]